MKNENRIPTILGLFFLIISLSAGVLLVSQRQIFRLGASGEFAPKDVRVTNISDTSFSVTFFTTKETQSAVVFGTKENQIDMSTQEEKSGSVHSVNLAGLKPQTRHFFKIVSGGSTFDQDGKAWSGTTGPTLAARPADIISGTVKTASDQPTAHALVYLTITDSSPLSTLTTSEGNFSVSLSNSRTSNLSSYVSYENTSILSVFVQAPPTFGTSQTAISTSLVSVGNARPMPPMILGQNHDFRKTTLQGEFTSPKSKIEIPGKNQKTPQTSPGSLESGQKSGFSTEPLVSAPPGGTNIALTIENPDEGENISTTKPEFFGKAPAGTSIEIIVESPVVKETIAASPAGSWSWSPKEALAPGKHKLTVTPKSGTSAPLTRNFTVLASAGSPAFSSTSSGGVASPSPSPSPSPTPKASPSPSPKPSAPPKPEIPVSGNLTMSLLLFILGIGSIFTGILLYQKSNIKNQN